MLNGMYRFLTIDRIDMEADAGRPIRDGANGVLRINGVIVGKWEWSNNPDNVSCDLTGFTEYGEKFIKRLQQVLRDFHDKVSILGEMDAQIYQGNYSRVTPADAEFMRWALESDASRKFTSLYIL